MFFKKKVSLTGNFCCLAFFPTEATLGFAYTKVKISLEFAKTRGVAKNSISKNLQTSKFESHELIIQPRMLKTPKN